MVDYSSSYICEICRKKVYYGLDEVLKVIKKYGRVICNWCIHKDRNGMLGKKNGKKGFDSL